MDTQWIWSTYCSSPDMVETCFNVWNNVTAMASIVCSTGSYNWDPIDMTQYYYQWQPLTSIAANVTIDLLNSFICSFWHILPHTIVEATIALLQNHCIATANPLEIFEKGYAHWKQQHSMNALLLIDSQLTGNVFCMTEQDSEMERRLLFWTFSFAYLFKAGTEHWDAMSCLQEGSCLLQQE